MKLVAGGHINNGVEAANAPNTSDEWIGDVFLCAKVLKSAIVANFPTIGLISCGCKIRRRFFGNFDLEFKFENTEPNQTVKKLMD